MAINFCQAHHSPVISNSHVCRDGYDVSNLISANQAVRRNGFCAEYFIKPPVEIVIEFPLPIDISHILIGLKVGEQQTTGVEIWSQYQPGNVSYNKDEEFAQIGRKFGITSTQVLFLNRFYSSREPFAKLPSVVPSVGVEVLQIQSKHYGNVSSAKALKIRLIKTLGSCAPAVSQLEVWGQPARSCGETAVSAILKNEQWSLPSSSAESSSSKDRAAKLPKESTNPCAKDFVNSSTNCVTDETMPSDFIDPLTCEVMTSPILLPSGHTIDQFTLEKYCDTEASWGRLPNDPFTGLRFNSDHKPIQNLPLKARIDQFLLKNGHLLKNIPRTLGSNNVYEKSSVQTSSLLNFSLDDGMVKNGKNISIGLKRSLDIEDISAKKQKQQEKDLFVAEPCTSLDKGNFVTEESQDLRYSRNLDEALKATLSGYKSYTKLASENGDSEGSSPCCNVCLSDAILYRLSCLHLLCRECLVQKSRKTQVICDTCCKPSTMANIARVHV